uniref:Uncharacterized protein n=1 Tax=Anopheles culicifacies TaxID=139723 RepID=A0A182MV58_9DIPT
MYTWCMYPGGAVSADDEEQLDKTGNNKIPLYITSISTRYRNRISRGIADVIECKELVCITDKQPIVLKYWNPWEKKDKDGNVIKTEPKNPFECVGGVCRFSGKSSAATVNTKESPHTTSETSEAPDETSKKTL